jgi:hypothetical protein
MQISQLKSSGCQQAENYIYRQLNYKNDTISHHIKYTFRKLLPITNLLRPFTFETKMDNQIFLLDLDVTSTQTNIFIFFTHHQTLKPLSLSL